MSIRADELISSRLVESEAHRSFPVAAAGYGRLRSIEKALTHIVPVDERGSPSGGALCGRVKPENILDDGAMSKHAEAATCKSCQRKLKRVG